MKRNLKRKKRQLKAKRNQKLLKQIKNAILLANQGQLEKSEQEFRRILSAHPNSFDANYHFGSLKFQTQGHERALCYLEKAVESKPSDMKALWLLSEIYYHTGRLRKGIELCREMLNIQQHNQQNEIVKKTSILTKLGDLQMRCNLYDEAEATLGIVLEAEPQNPLANLLTAKVNRSTGNLDESLQRLEKMTSGFGDNNFLAGIQAELCLVYDRLGRHEDAVNAAIRSNSLMASSSAENSIDRNVVPTLIDRIQDFVNSGNPPKVQREQGVFDTKSPIFLVGFPRSGTTLTEQLLSDTFGLIGSTELPFLTDTRLAIPSLIKRDFNYPEDIHILTPSEIELTRKYYMNLAFEALGIDSASFDRYIDKLPLNIIHLPFINTIFPDCKVIVALRDPRDVCLSCFFQQFQLNESMIHFLNIDDTVNLYYKIMNLWLSCKQTYTFSYTESRYEELVQDKAGSIDRIGDYLELEKKTSAAIELPVRSGNRNRMTLSTPNHYEATQPVYKRSMDRWRNYSNLLEKHFEKLEPIIIKLGYKM